MSTRARGIGQEPAGEVPAPQTGAASHEYLPCPSLYDANGNRVENGVRRAAFTALVTRDRAGRMVQMAAANVELTLAVDGEQVEGPHLAEVGATSYAGGRTPPAPSGKPPDMNWSAHICGRRSVWITSAARRRGA
jgi:hypothetical protein